MTTTALLDDFCHRIMEQVIPSKGLNSTALAQEFVAFFDLSTFPRMEEITAQLRRAGVRTTECSQLRDLRGYHTGTKNGDYLIEYDASDWDGAQEQTVLHEFYEIVRERLKDLHPAVWKPQGRGMCREADRFAAAVLMQPEVFSAFAERSGLDVVALQRVYGRAYSTVALRLVEVMQHQPLLTVLYERKEAGEPHQWSETCPPERFKTSVVARTPGFRLRTTRRPLSCLRAVLPRRGSAPAPGSVAERVVLTGKPVYVERVSGYDLWRADDLSVAASPVFWYGKLAKIAVIAVPYHDRPVLGPQVCRAVFQRIPEAHQVI